MASKKKPNRPRPPSARGAPSRPPVSAGTAMPAPAKAPSGRPAGAKPAGPKGPTRAERLAAAEKARRAKATRTRALIAGGLVAVVTILAVTVISSRRSNDRNVAKVEASGSCKYGTRADTDSGAGNNHVDGNVKYTIDPPAGGNHNPSPAPAGIFTAETKPPDVRLVHSLEHGYVVIWYRPDIAAGTLDDLKALAGRYPRDLLLVPRDTLAQPAAATAWHRRLICSSPDLQALETFVTTYRNKGPERIPH